MNIFVVENYINNETIYLRKHYNYKLTSNVSISNNPPISR